MIFNIPNKIKEQNFPKSALYVLATPIGNMYDITLRALYVLSISDTIVCENIKQIKKLLNFYKLKKNLITLHKFNEKKNINFIIKRLINNERISLVSNSGTPTISDPGYKLIKYIYKYKFKIIPIPGVSAVITALSVSGLNNKQFKFIGFLPKEKKEKEKILQNLKNEKIILVFYETPHRIKKTIKLFIKFFNNETSIIFAKELTKIFENIYKCKLKKALSWIKKNKYNQKGEFVILLNSVIIKKKEEKYKNILKILFKELTFKKLINITYNITKNKKKDIYKYAINLKNNFKKK
ncbi:16S rRNA (cytidine(1402)-2'-O)-methyltransferase [Candidatus Zinderia endosymbiont of Aphrophora alni]|uniref:16S rRNA (cytidine(1402)-2'-O)-methyltransferase n=1 Tax=Candidatus Zinderia endosymbiont of Aphrophora alni TaxID=3077951 RepID=UPI0030CF69A8